MAKPPCLPTLSSAPPASHTPTATIHWLVTVYCYLPPRPASYLASERPRPGRLLLRVRKRVEVGVIRKVSRSRPQETPRRRIPRSLLNSTTGRWIVMRGDFLPEPRRHILFALGQSRGVSVRRLTQRWIRPPTFIAYLASWFSPPIAANDLRGVDFVPGHSAGRLPVGAMHVRQTVKVSLEGRDERVRTPQSSYSAREKKRVESL